MPPRDPHLAESGPRGRFRCDATSRFYSPASVIYPAVSHLPCAESERLDRIHVRERLGRHPRVVARSPSASPVSSVRLPLRQDRRLSARRRSVGGLLSGCRLFGSLDVGSCPCDGCCCRAQRGLSIDRFRVVGVVAQGARVGGERVDAASPWPLPRRQWRAGAAAWRGRARWPSSDQLASLGERRVDHVAVDITPLADARLADDDDVGEHVETAKLAA